MRPTVVGDKLYAWAAVPRNHANAVLVEGFALIPDMNVEESSIREIPSRADFDRARVVVGAHAPLSNVIHVRAPTSYHA